MCDYIRNMLVDPFVNLKPKEVTPTRATETIFTVKQDSLLLLKKHAEEYHTIVAKVLFVC